MRVLIVGIDGLEYNLVVEEDLRNLMQKEYGKAVLPSEVYYVGGEIHTPYTPVVWASFLTGKLPSEHGVTQNTWITWDSGLLAFLKRVSVKVGLGRVKNKGKIFQALGFKRRAHAKQDYRVPTVFDLTPNSTQVNVPTIDLEWDIRLLPRDAEFNIRRIEREWWRKYQRIKEEILERIDGEWELFMGYTRVLDVFGHLFWGKRRKMVAAYSDINEFVGRLRDKVGEETVVLIVSDHGMRSLEGTRFGGHHTDYAFYSLNRPVGLVKPRITDFFDLCRSWLGE